MSRSNLLEEVRVESIFHPSDFSEASEVAFVHALKIALVAGATFTMLHVEASPGTEWQDFPRRTRHPRAMGTHTAGKSNECGRKARHQS